MTKDIKRNDYCIEVCGQELPDKDSEICDSCIKQYQCNPDKQEKGEDNG